MDDDAGTVKLHVQVDSEEERAALEQALLRARATELAEVRRNQFASVRAMATRRRETR